MPLTKAQNETIWRMTTEQNITDIHTNGRGWFVANGSHEGTIVIVGKMPRNWDEWGVWNLYTNGSTGNGTYVTNELDAQRIAAEKDAENL